MEEMELEYGIRHADVRRGLDARCSCWRDPGNTRRTTRSAC